MFPDLNFPNAVYSDTDAAGRCIFYGRKMERAQIEATLRSGTGRPVAILGERRIGKTSLLAVTVSGLGERFVPVSLPPPLAISSLNDYAREILQAIGQKVGADISETGFFDQAGQMQFRSYTEFAASLARMLRPLQGRVFILCIDEFDAMLLNCASDGGKVVALTEHLVEMHDLPLVLMMTITRMPEIPRDELGSPLLSKFEIIELGPLPQSEMEELVPGVLGPTLSIAPQAVQEVLHLSGGSPYFAKLILHRLLMRHTAATNDFTFMPEDLAGILPGATDDPRARAALENIYGVHFSESEKTLVVLLAGREGGLPRADLASLGAPFLRSAQELVRRGYLGWQEDNLCDFRLQFLRHWLRRWQEYETERDRLNISSLEQRLGVDLVVNPVKGEVTMKGVPVKLGVQLFKALAFLAQHAEQLVTRDQLVDVLWPDAAGDVTDQAIDAIIHRLRQKLKDDDHIYLETVAGQGFRLHRAAIQAGA